MNGSQDKTAAKRMRERNKRIKESGLSNLKVVMHPDDSEKVRAYARTLYRKRGLEII